MGWTGVKVLWRDAAENTSRMSTENPVTAFVNLHLLWWRWNVDVFCFGRFLTYFPTVTTDNEMTLHYIVCLYLLLLGHISFALVTSYIHILALCKSLSQHYILGVAHMLLKEVSYIHRTNGNKRHKHIPLNHSLHQMSFKSQRILSDHSPFLKSQETWPLRLLRLCSCSKFNL